MPSKPSVGYERAIRTIRHVFENPSARPPARTSPKTLFVVTLRRSPKTIPETIFSASDSRSLFFFSLNSRFSESCVLCDSEVLHLCIREPHGLLGMGACTKECSGRYTGVGFQPSISQVVTSFFPGIPLLRTASLSTESLPVSPCGSIPLHLRPTAVSLLGKGRSPLLSTRGRERKERKSQREKESHPLRNTPAHVPV